MALGARPGRVFWLVIREGMAVTTVGTIVGLLGGLAFTRFLASWLYGVTPTDPLAFAASVLVLAVVAFLACWVPARRATRADPAGALRCE